MSDDVQIAALAAGLSKAQREALALSADGWPLSFYIPYGARYDDRGGAVGRPYWQMRRGLETPKAPHWATATSLQNLGLIHHGDDAESCTPLGLSVRRHLEQERAK